MWAAEGSLRVAQPQDALAPEHRALDILKEFAAGRASPTCSTSVSKRRR